jgi:hypothetical protein
MKTNSPTEQEIAHRARALWQERGQPTGQDTQIWLEAERQLSTPAAAPNLPSPTEGRGNGKTQAGKSPADPKPADLKPKPVAGGQTERLRGEMASESEVEYQITPAPSDDAAIKAALQKRDARTPQKPVKTAPQAKPPETGKPVWPKPHSA